jgi:hypothetical protein
MAIRNGKFILPSIRNQGRRFEIDRHRIAFGFLIGTIIMVFDPKRLRIAGNPEMAIILITIIR